MSGDRDDPGLAHQRTLVADPETSAPAAPDAPLRLGDKLGRFDIIKRLGAGGMGVVYVALDPVLNRQVAVKLLRAGASGPLGAEAARGRLVREAQAMARLSHPNVITVHEVGTVGDRVFIVMELNDGKNLTDWLEGKPPLSEIINVFVNAGRGLVAAHTAGLIHRDFKPDNVLIGRDGRVRVTDFGLVDSLVKPRSRPDSNAPRISQGGMLGVSLTHTGAVLGTPPYMAPEQHDSGEVDARTDQYSFCVSLYEALYGVRPFGGAKYRDLVLNILEGRMQPRPEGTAVPMEVHEMLLKGLSLQRADRFDSLTELLDRLEDVGARPAPPSTSTSAAPTLDRAATAPPARRRRRRWPVALGGVLLAIAATATAVVLFAGNRDGSLDLRTATPLAPGATLDAGVAAATAADAAPPGSAPQTPDAAPPETVAHQHNPEGRKAVKAGTDGKPEKPEVKPETTAAVKPDTTEVKPDVTPETRTETAAERRRRELDLDMGKTPK